MSEQTLNSKLIKLSFVNLVAAFLLALIFIFLTIYGFQKFRKMQDFTTEYILSESAAQELKEGSIYLTEQVRLYAMTGELLHMNNYFDEAFVTKRRENAVAELKRHFDKTPAFKRLTSALEESNQLMQTEYHSMRLVAEAQGEDIDSLPELVKSVKLLPEEESLSSEEKMIRAQQIVIDRYYRNSRSRIFNNVSGCLDELIQMTTISQEKSSKTFFNMFIILSVGICVFTLLYFGLSVIVFRILSKKES